MKRLLQITRHELATFFATPAALIFLAVFLFACLFIFFWVDTFFARNIADLRPLFESMPILLIFLSATITMRLWTEERRSGTLELLLTSPISPLTLVLGKFLACMALIVIALLLTAPLPLTIGWIADLDWGPVIAAYLATLFLAATYIAIGLYVSARSENPLVSLIVSTLVCGLFYLLGSATLTELFPTRIAEWLRLLGTGSRFESISRGVIDLADIYYYLSLVAVFLTLNVHALEKRRWTGTPPRRHHRQWAWLTLLLSLNLLFANIPLSRIEALRIDMTEGQLYTLSPASRQILAGLQEPLLIRGYFSAQTHPLLAPLVPRLTDLLQEYAIASENRVRVEIIDPHEDPESEREAGQRYGIKPVPFQTANRYEASVVNSYFDIVISYGDQFETLGFRDLIDIKAINESDVHVDLRNPEYDITRAIRKTVQAYQSAGDLFTRLPDELTLHAYVSPAAQLPEPLQKLRQELLTIAEEMSTKAAGRLLIDVADPAANGGQLGRQLRERFGYRQMTTSLLDERRFWFYMQLDDGHRQESIPLPEDLSAATLKRSIEAAIKRYARGFLKTITIVGPPAEDPMARFTPGAARQLRFTQLRQRLAEDYTLVDNDLGSGSVPPETDLLLLLAPGTLDQQQLFAVDQFLMQGGTVIVSTSPFAIELSGRLSASKQATGLEEWLAEQGIELAQEFVLDPKNTAFPVPIQRNIGGFLIQEAQLVDYPFFIDIRRDGMERSADLLSGVEQLTMSWASPIRVDVDKQPPGRRLQRLLQSSEQSWTTSVTELQPDFERYGQLGFPAAEKRGRQLLALISEGRFDSFFRDRPLPVSADKDQDAEETTAIERLIEHSPESARLILIASNSFASDQTLDLVSSSLGTRYLFPVEFLQNAVDWSLEDRSLLALRGGRAQFSRILPPMDRSSQQFWEYLNYGLALTGLLLVWLLHRLLRVRSQRRLAMLIHSHQTGGTV